MKKIYAVIGDSAQTFSRECPVGMIEMQTSRPDGDYIAGADGQWIIDPLAAVRAFKVSREALVKAITVEVDGMVFDGDEISQGRMSRAVAASGNSSETTTWILADNTPATVTAAQLKQALRLAGAAQTAVWVMQ